MYSLRRSGAVFFMLKISKMTYNSKAEFYERLNRVIGCDIVFWYEKYFK